mmetsp:Transcript_18751/g.58928  ORF Transcript_18751/g.58928 Transcript_18751/m.58928 type:complete len:240 (-) Transcript_18751:399-1118(-)
MPIRLSVVCLSVLFGAELVLEALSAPDLLPGAQGQEHPHEVVARRAEGAKYEHPGLREALVPNGEVGRRIGAPSVGGRLPCGPERRVILGHFAGRLQQVVDHVQHAGGPHAPGVEVRVLREGHIEVGVQEEEEGPLLRAQLRALPGEQPRELLAQARPEVAALPDGRKLGRRAGVLEEGADVAVPCLAPREPRQRKVPKRPRLPGVRARGQGHRRVRPEVRMVVWAVHLHLLEFNLLAR